MAHLLGLLGLVVLCLRGADAGVASGAWLAVTGVRLAATDAREHRLPNALTVPGVLVGAASAVISQDGLALLAMAGTAGVAAAGWAVGAIGMGDVKLGAALAGAVALLAGGSGLMVGGLALVVLAGSAAAQAMGAGTPRIPLGPPLILAAWIALALS